MYTCQAFQSRLSMLQSSPICKCSAVTRQRGFAAASSSNQHDATESSSKHEFRYSLAKPESKEVTAG